MMKIPNFRSSLASIACAALGLAAAFLFVPPPQHARAQFADQGAWATATSVTASGATTVTLTLNNVSSLNDIVGVNISFNPAANSTGPVSIVVTGSAGTTAPTALQRPSSLGLVALSMNELWAGETTSVKYNGSVFVLTSNVDMTSIGKVVEFRGAAAPRGTLIEDGSCVSQATYAALFSVIGTGYGACSTGLFALPDSRGSMFAARDGQGVNGLAGRITTATCASPNLEGTHCGAQTAALTSTANMPPYAPSGSVSGSFSGSGSGNVPTPSVLGQGPVSTTAGDGAQVVYYASGASIPALAVTVTSVSGSISGSLSGASVGSSAPFPSLNPVLLGISAIKF